MYSTYPCEIYDEYTLAEWNFSGWFSVENENGVIAVFMTEADAERFAVHKMVDNHEEIEAVGV